MNTIISPLKTGKGNNVKVARKVLEQTVKGLKPFITPLPTQPEGETPIAYEYGACTAGERLFLISTAFQERLENSEAKGLKFGRANLIELVNRLEACATELADTGKDKVMALAATLREIVEPTPKPEADGKAKGKKEKGKKPVSAASEPAQAPGI